MLRFTIGVLVILSTFNVVWAEGLHAVKPLPGYVCMQLALTPQQLTSSKVGVPIRVSPSGSAPIASYAANTVIAYKPQQSKSGFVEVLSPNGETGWIEAGFLRPWKNDFASNAKCTPAIMSNGKPGFGSLR